MCVWYIKPMFKIFGEIILIQIFFQVWGHSMGAAVASLAVASTASQVNHLVLESPFNNLADEVFPRVYYFLI